MSKRISLTFLAVTALVLSRVIFMLINDPEGPNLLVVFVGAAIISLPALTLCYSGGTVFQRIVPASLTDIKRLLLGILIQVFTAGVVLFLIK